MGHIFISYSKKDVLYAERLVNALKREGFDPWVDVDELGPGTHWQDRLQKQIQTCDAYILIMSKKARASRWVPDELVTAKSANKPIFPLLLEDTELFLAIQTVQFEDVRGGRLPSEVFYQRLAAVTPRRKKINQKVETVSLTDAARQQKVDKAAERVSYYLSKLSSGVKDVIAVAAKVSSNTYKSLADSVTAKKASNPGKPKPKTVKKKKK